MEITKQTVKNYIIKTPYVGYDTVSDLKHMETITSCGACAVCMILSLNKIKINYKKFIQQGHKDGGYASNGWSHDYLVKKLKENNLNYTRFENCSIKQSINQINESILKNNPVIVSVNKFCLEQTSFHMILITGIKINSQKSIIGFFYHDPAAITSKNGSYRYVSIENFMQFWRKMMIIKI